ncbi:hypothetical protein R83H12_02661 [Fibrobacteria bacterium R8-3-H12]
MNLLLRCQKELGLFREVASLGKMPLVFLRCLCRLAQTFGLNPAPRFLCRIFVLQSRSQMNGKALRTNLCQISAKQGELQNFQSILFSHQQKLKALDAQVLELHALCAAQKKLPKTAYCFFAPAFSRLQTRLYAPNGNHQNYPKQSQSRGVI